jgi:pimeloyl-ACP methyl ester carboxylesterase
MTLRDGRELGWLETGKARGTPVFMFHGTPGSRLQVSFDEKAIAASGVRLVAPDRPGSGHSSFHRGRTLTDWAADVASLADHLKVERFAVAGVSGGGPHAVACARLLPERVTAAAIVSGVGPISDPDFATTMVEFNRAATKMAARTPAFVLTGVFSAQEFFLRHWPDTALRVAVKRLAEPDAALFERPAVRVGDHGPGGCAGLRALRPRLGLPAAGRVGAHARLARRRRQERPLLTRGVHGAANPRRRVPCLPGRGSPARRGPSGGDPADGERRILNTT